MRTRIRSAVAWRPTIPKFRLSRTAVFAFVAVYVIWGSTYLAIRTAIETLPPWGLSASRYCLAGLAMVFLARLRGELKLSRREMATAAVSGPLLVAANGVVCVAEQWVPSGVAAVVIGAMPIWVMLIGWAAFRQARPTSRKIGGALIGLCGIALIASGQPERTHADAGPVAFGSLLLVGSSLLWAFGTLVQRRTSSVSSAFLFSGYQMLFGSLLAATFSAALEKPWTLALDSISLASIGAFAYLVTFGSIVGFTAYGWLSRNVEPHLASTYALVNPLIAVALGSFFYQEPITPRFAGAAALVLVGLALLVFGSRGETKTDPKRT